MIRMFKKWLAAVLAMVGMFVAMAGGSTAGAMATQGLPLGTTASPGAPLPGQAPFAATTPPGQSPITGPQVAALQPQALAAPPLDASVGVSTTGDLAVGTGASVGVTQTAPLANSVGAGVAGATTSFWLL